MEEKYKIFNKGFNKILDLITDFDDEIIRKYKKIVDILPSSVVAAMNECDDFATECDEFNVDFMRLVNAVSLDFARYKNYLRTEICVHRFFREDLFKNNLSLKIFSINLRNTKKKKPDLQFFYKEVDGKYVYEETNDNAEKNIDLSMEIYLDSRGDEYYLVCIKNFRGIEVSQKEKLVSFDELMQSVEDEDDFEEDMEIEFDADFDL